MATYVPGTKTYLPDIKSFTPDYKFLSAVLDVREDKYNANWQATNDIYNKVVYADLSREDTTEQREQYVNNIGPSLEKIAGMDLSLAQNAQSAKAVFAPFFEDKLIVQDMVNTTNYRKEMGHIGRLLSSPDPDMNGQYWRDGKAELQYKMEDFINMSPDEALNTRIGKYVPKANLFKISQQILSEQKPPLSIEYDSVSENGDWIITKKNGEAVVGPALQILRNQLSTDGRVVQAYQTQAYVAGRDFAAAGMNDGSFSSVEEGQQAWAESTISNIEFNNNERLKKDAFKLNEQRNVNVRWDSYKKTNGVIPGSDDDKLMNEQLSAYEKTKLAMKNNMDVRDVINTPTEGLETTLNRAYQLLRMTNMDSDMVKAAQSFSMRDMKSTIRVNKYALQNKQFKMDLAKISANATNRRNLAFDIQAQKHKDDTELAEKKGELVDDGLLNVLNDNKAIIGGSNTNEFAVDKKGKITPNTDVQNLSFNQKNNDDIALQTDKIKAILSSLRLEEPRGKVIDGKNTHEWTIETSEGEFTGTLKEIEYKLSARTELTEEQVKNGVNPNYVNGESINQIFDRKKESITAVDRNGNLLIKSTNIGLASNPDFHSLLGLFNKTSINQDISDKTYTALLKRYHEASKITDGYVLSENSRVKKMTEAGMPSIMEKTKSGITHMLSKKEYIEKVMAGVAAGTITNVDHWGLDKGTGNKNYMIQERKYRPGIASGKYNSPVFNTDGSPKMIIDEEAVADEAGEVYDAYKQRLNQGLTNSLDKSKMKGIQTGTYESMKLGLTDNAGDLYSGVTYSGFFDPKIKGGEGNAILKQYVIQDNYLSSIGQNATMFSGSMKDIDNEENNEVSQKFMNEYIQDVRSYIGNPKSSSSIPASPRGTWTYSPVYGDEKSGTKTTAAYTFTPTEEYIDSKAKGGLDQLGNPKYGGYKKEEKKLLRKGITIMFDQNLDQNPLKKSNNWGNPIVAEIMSNPQGIALTNVYDKNSDNTGSYSYSKLSDNMYTLNYQYNTYIPSVDGVGGSFTLSPLQSHDIPINGSDFSELNKSKARMNEIFAQKSLVNELSKKKDDEVNGVK